jgi:hypothetical protein
MAHPEQDIRVGIVSYLRMMGWAVWDLEQNRRTRQTAGLPDLFLAGFHRTVWVEVKTPTGRLSDAQAVFREEMRANGHEWHLWRSVEQAHVFHERIRFEFVRS